MGLLRTDHHVVGRELRVCTNPGAARGVIDTPAINNKTGDKETWHNCILG